MTITPAQRISIMRTWQRVCKDRGWKSSDRDLRLQTFGELIGRAIASTDDVGRIDECTKLMKGLTAMLGVSLQAAREADDTSINQGRVLRHQIAGELIPCLELYIQDVPSYITTIIEDKSRWWKLDRPARSMTILDLSAAPIFRTVNGEAREFPSPLKQLQFTLAARLNSLRKAAGHSIHDMKIKASVPCGCSACVSARNLAEVPQPF